MTREEMMARIAELEALVSASKFDAHHRVRRTAAEREALREARAREKARRRQFRHDAMMRRRRHLSGINRYSIYR